MAPRAHVEVVDTATTGYTVVTPDTVENDVVVTVSVEETVVVEVTAHGVLVTVEVEVTVEMCRKELQKGVATACSCMIEMIVFTAAQFTPPFLSTRGFGLAAAAAANSRARPDFSAIMFAIALFRNECGGMIMIVLQWQKTIGSEACPG